jgi:hypothetical protein
MKPLFNDAQVQQMTKERREDDARLAAARVSQARKGKTERRPSGLEDSPLFGGERQGGLFGTPEGK